MSRLVPGTPVTTRTLTDVTGREVALTGDGLVHLQFRRFAGCPVCNLHLRSIVVRHEEIRAAGIREVVVFHSPGSELREYADGLPFPLVGDPARRLYREFGVERGRRALLNPRAWPVIARAIGRSVVAVARRRENLPASRQENGRLGLPADFLIAPDGRILAAHYGEHAADQWPVDALLATSRPFADTAGRA
ncbi:peroxiredoxin-like family protein [Actinocorallia longicatena]|uniref:Peroxiredoxin-like family protein n=1 Tax=Actinocorallia longicatena TaxID=111803 RepID=A0ABP6Q125_9ACTN